MEERMWGNQTKTFEWQAVKSEAGFVDGASESHETLPGEPSVNLQWTFGEPSVNLALVQSPENEHCPVSFWRPILTQRGKAAGIFASSLFLYKKLRGASRICSNVIVFCFPFRQDRLKMVRYKFAPKAEWKKRVKNSVRECTVWLSGSLIQRHTS